MLELSAYVRVRITHVTLIIWAALLCLCVVSLFFCTEICTNRARSHRVYGVRIFLSSQPSDLIGNDSLQVPRVTWSSWLRSMKQWAERLHIRNQLKNQRKLFFFISGLTNVNACCRCLHCVCILHSLYLIKVYADSVWLCVRLCVMSSFHFL